MDASASPSPRLLIVDDDPDIREALRLLFEDQGYAVYVGSSLEGALALVDASAFDCILTDLFAKGAADPLASIATLRHRAFPTPIIVMTAWRIQVGQAEPHGISDIVAKPFELDELLAAVASGMKLPLNEHQERQVRVVHAYFAALTAKDWDALMALCTDDVTYTLPGALPFSGVVRGKSAFRAYTVDTYQHFGDAVFDQVRVYARPHGLAARFHGRWHDVDGTEQQQSGSVLFRFADEHIAHIGVELNTARLQEVMRSLQAHVRNTEAASS